MVEIYREVASDNSYRVILKSESGVKVVVPGFTKLQAEFVIVAELASKSKNELISFITATDDKAFDSVIKAIEMLSDID